MYRCLLVATFCVVIVASAAVAFSQTLSYYNIENQSGWQSCSACAGGQNSSNNFTGPIQVTSPSLDGTSARFTLRYPWPSYANALWWKDELMGAGDHATISTLHGFTYDLYYYIKKPRFSQALEFDLTQTICNDNPCTATSKSTRYKYGTECNQNAGVWRIWNGTAWVSTGITCRMPAYTWNHLHFEFARTSTNQVQFISLTANGVKHYLDGIYPPITINAPADDFNADFQMDGDFYGHPYDTWIDEMTLIATTQ
jgi:hypothetical protein